MPHLHPQSITTSTINHCSKILNTAAVAVLKRSFPIFITDSIPEQKPCFLLVGLCPVQTQLPCSLRWQNEPSLKSQPLYVVCLPKCRLSRVFITFPMSCMASLDSTPETYCHH